VFTARTDGPLAGFDLNMGTEAVVVGRVYARGLAVGIVRKRGELPGPGTYPIHDYADHSALPEDRFGLFTWYYDLNGETYLCRSTSGVLTLTATSNSRVQGSYRAPARCTTSNSAVPPRTVELQGTFDAVLRA
jgi:hypothetical protein